jgi:hypothetical protein
MKLIEGKKYWVCVGNHFRVLQYAKTITRSLKEYHIFYGNADPNRFSSNSFNPADKYMFAKSMLQIEEI